MPSKRKPNRPLDELRRTRVLVEKERLKRLKRENAWGDGQVILRKDFDRFLSLLFSRQKGILYSRVQSELPVQLEGQDAVTIRGKLRETADGICDEMQEMLRSFEFEEPPRLPDREVKEANEED